MKKWLTLAASVLLMFTCIANTEEESLAALAAPHGFKIGAPLSYLQMQDRSYLNLIRATSTAPPPPTR